MCGTVILCRDSFPLVERRIANRFDALPLLHAFRPATFGFLIARVSNSVISNRVEPALSLYGTEDFVFDPVFQKMQRSLASTSSCASLFFFQKSRTTIVKNLAQ